MSASSLNSGVSASFEDENSAGNGAFMEIDLSVKVDDQLGGFCSTISDIGGAVSGKL